MSIISPINNVTNIIAENSLSNTQSQLQTTLQQLSTGNELVSPAIAPANSSIAAGLNANIAALTQSAQNTQNGVGELQTAAGALSQVTTLLNTAIPLATQGATSGSEASPMPLAGLSVGMTWISISGISDMRSTG